MGLIWFKQVKIKNWGFDDSFFGYTYAKNLSEGNGFTFNGEKEIGTSAPLPPLVYAATSIAAKSVGKPIEIHKIAEYISIASIILTAILLLFLIKELTGSSIAGFLGGIFIYFNIFYLMMFGHESILAIMFSILSILLAAKKKFIFSYFVLALAFLCRAETIFTLPILLYFNFLTDPKIYKNIKKIFLSITVFAIPLTLWYTYSYFTFGRLFSHSFDFKILQSQIQGTTFIDGLHAWIVGFGGKNLFAFAFILLFLLIPYFIKVPKKILIINICFAIIPIVFYTIIKISFYHWFLFLLTIPISINLGYFYARFLKDTKLNIPNLLNHFALMFLLALMLYTNSRVVKSFGITLPSPAVTAYKSIGFYVKEKIPNDKTIAFLENGAIGYYSGHKIIDTTGMVTKDVVSELKKGNTFFAYTKYKPDYILWDKAFAGFGDPTTQFFISRYKLKDTLKYPGYRPLYLYEKVYDFY